MQKAHDIFLLIGQSNMAGRGFPDDVPPIRDARIRMFRNGAWQAAAEPLHTDKPETAGVGPGMSFAAALLETDPDRTIGLVPCAVGSTPLARWLPGADLYESAAAALENALQNGYLKGILWHQGEADTWDSGNAAAYADRFITAAAGWRTRFGSPRVPVIVGELGPFLRRDHSETVNRQLRSLPDKLPVCGCVGADGLKDNGDALHFNARSQRELGKRYAQMYANLNWRDS